MRVRVRSTRPSLCRLSAPAGVLTAASAPVSSCTCRPVSGGIGMAACACRSASRSCLVRVRVRVRARVRVTVTVRVRVAVRVG